jgi:hypothetical protein
MPLSVAALVWADALGLRGRLWVARDSTRETTFQVGYGRIQLAGSGCVQVPPTGHDCATASSACREAALFGSMVSSRAIGP